MLLCLTMLMSVASLCVSASADGDVLNVGVKADIETMDVHMTTADYSIPLNVYDRLFELTINDAGSAELVKSLVEDYSVSEDALTYSFTLRDDVYFSNGDKLTAADVAYSFTRMVSVEASEQEYLFESVAGYDEFTGSGNYHDAVLTGIEVADDTHFSITLSVPYAGFLNILASPACCIYSKAAVEAAGENFGSDYTQAIGSGAYVVTDWTHDSSITLAANDLYWGTAPDFKNVVIHIIPDADTLGLMFQSNEIDILDCNYIDAAIVGAVYKTMYADKIVSVSRLGTSYMALNASVLDLAERKAVQMCIDRDLIIAALLNGDAVTLDGIYPKGLVGYCEDNQGWLSYDPAGAAAVLEEAGYTKDANGYYFDMTLLNDESHSSTRQSVVFAIPDQLQKAGINCSVETVDHSSWLAARKAGEITAYVSTWTADYNDPDNFIATFWGSENKTLGRSLMYEDVDVMARVSAATAIVDDAERAAEYAELEKIIVEQDASWVPLYAETHLFVLGTGISSFVPHWAGYSDFRFVDVKAA